MRVFGQLWSCVIGGLWREAWGADLPPRSDPEVARVLGEIVGRRCQV